MRCGPWKYLMWIVCVALVAAACTQAEPTPVTTRANPSLDDLPAGAAAFEFEVLSVGAADRTPLLQASPVAKTQNLTVNIASGGTSVRATLHIEVLQSRADGSSETLQITATGLSASDPLMAEDLSARVGASVQAERGPNRVVRSYAKWDLDPGDVTSSGDSDDDQVTYWVTQLLIAAVSAGPPLPTEPLGEGASWSTILQASDGSRVDYTGVLEHFDAARYVVAINTNTEQSEVIFEAILEGTVGHPVPDRQDISLSLLDPETSNWSVRKTTITES